MGYIEDLFALKEKIALVTGAGQGIGEAIALSYMKAGIHVILAGRTCSKLERVAKLGMEDGSTCEVYPLDIQSESDILACFAHIRGKYGCLDILVNNAGVSIRNNAENLSLEDWNTVITTNLTGSFLCAREAGNIMLAQRKGKIINITSTYAFVGRYQRVAYASSKGGELQMTKTMAVEWAPYNICVNALAPTATVTPMTNALQENSEALKNMLQKIPMGRLAKPEEMVGAALYLASEASNFVTGQTILVDGGFTAI